MDTTYSKNRKFKRMFVTILSIFVVVVMMFSGMWSPARAAFPGDNGKIAFMSNRDSNFEIYVMKSEGSNQTNLTNNPAQDGQPTWSPDGSRIAFESDRDGNYEIYAMNADGTDPTRLTTDPSTDTFPNWSPDGSQIVFARYDLSINNYDIWRMNSDGTDLVQLTDNPSEDTEPVWSPDGTKIAFRTMRDGNMEIYLMNPDGTDQTNLTNHPAEDGESDWSPDGSKIAFGSTRDGFWGAIWVMNADGSGPTRLTDAVYGDGHPSWSPDGTKIVFKGFRAFNDEIYVMNADGTSVTRLTNNAPPGNTLPEDWFPDWQPSSIVAMTYIVNTTDDNDDGTCDVSHCSLREAINAANANLAVDTITFNIPGDAPFTIQPQSALPNIDDPVTIDGSTQPGFKGSPVIELDGTNAGDGVNGLTITAGSSTVKGLVINRYSNDGIVLMGSGGNIVQGNYIGTNVTGTVALGNSGRGIFVAGGTSDNLIGGNLISGNGAAGVRITDVGTSGNKVQGNFIGTDFSGTIPLGNSYFGVRVSDGAAKNVIGGTEEGVRNIISGNRDSGVLIDGNETTGNIVQGNYIGTNVTGTTTAGLDPGMFTVMPVDPICPTYPAGTSFDNFVSEAEDPLAPWSGTSVTFRGTEECGSPEMLGEASLIYRYKLEFTEDTQLTSIAVSGAAFNGSDNILRVLDQDMNVLGSVNTFGGNSFQIQYMMLDGVVGRTFYIDEFDTSSTWRFRQSIVINGPAPLGNLGNGVVIAGGALGNLIGGTYSDAGNLISGNGGEGIGIYDPGTAGNIIQGNFIGTDATGAMALPNSLRGIFIVGGPADNLIGGTESGAGNLVSGNMLSGVNITDGHRTLVQGNLIGTNIEGTTPLPNLGNGVVIDGGATDNVIGGTDPGARNLLSGNFANGVWISNPGTTGNIVQGNYIGTDTTGTQSLGNAAPGVGIGDQAFENLIIRNLISGNKANGVDIFNPGTMSNTLRGNLIGTDASGTVALPNSGVGVWIGDGASNTLIGGDDEGAGNIISGNNGDGISINHAGTTGNIIQGNHIGLNALGNAPLPNSSNGVILVTGTNNNLIAGNIISGNKSEGVAIFDPDTTNNTVQGNYIGTDVTGTTTTGPAGPDPGEYMLTVMPETCPTYPAGTDFDGFVSESDDPLAPWSGTSVTFRGTEECTDREMLGAASLIYRYKLEFAGTTQLTSIAVTGAAFNGPDNVLRVLDENMNTLRTANTFGGNSFQTPYVALQGVEGKVFYVDEFDTSSTWRFRQSIVVNGPAPLGNYSNGVLIANGASGNLVDGNVLSGNSQNGVGLFNPGTTGNIVQNNYIGTDSTGMQSLGNAAPGVSIGDQAFDNRIAGNLISGNRSDGIAIFNPGTAGNSLQGNLIGTDVSGNTALPNTGVGVWIGEGASNTLIGGVEEGEGNLISGNAVHGVSINHLETMRTQVLGNHIGTNKSGDAALPNGAGGVYVSASQTWIGGAEPGARNLISGNAGFGIDFQEAATENFVQNNLIGTDASGTLSLGNSFSGINFGSGVAGNTIGGTDPGVGNTIAFNSGRGIRAIAEAGSGNAMLSNSVFSNGLLGIDLNADSVTLNDPLDQDAGPNNLQNFPVIISVTRKGTSMMINGLLVSAPGTTYRLEFFRNDTCDPSGFGEGQTFVGSAVVTTNPVGIANFKITLPGSLQDAFVTATATDSGGNTSEFSKCVGPVK